MSGKKSRVSRMRKSRVSRKRTSRKSKSLPKTMKMPSKKTSLVRRKFSKARHDMQITDLQFMAKSLGIPFGGLSKMQLVRKINNYQ
jgi:cell fate regulator YaaT (PSP1 superfamily)